MQIPNITPSSPESILGRAGFGKGTVGGLVTLDMKEVSLLLLAFVPEPGLGVYGRLRAGCHGVRSGSVGPFSQTEQRLRKVGRKTTNSCLNLTALCLVVLSLVMGDRKPGEAPCWGCPAGLGGDFSTTWLLSEPPVLCQDIPGLCFISTSPFGPSTSQASALFLPASNTPPFRCLHF